MVYLNSYFSTYIFNKIHTKMYYFTKKYTFLCKKFGSIKYLLYFCSAK